MALCEDLAGEPGKYEEVITVIDAFNAGRSVTIHPFAADIRADCRSPDQLILVCGLLFYCSMDAHQGWSPQMEDLLRGCTELLRGFNRFIPWSYIRAHGQASYHGVTSGLMDQQAGTVPDRDIMSNKVGGHPWMQVLCTARIHHPGDVTLFDKYICTCKGHQRACFIFRLCVLECAGRRYFWFKIVGPREKY
jgi:hypothetical protein